MILGINEFDSSLDDAIDKLGIIFLFCISGLHISLLSIMIKKLLRFFNTEEEYISVFLIIFLLLYEVIANSSSSLKRAILIIIISEITSLKRTKLTKLDSLSITFIILLIYNPFSIFEIGFYLSFLSTSIIYLSRPKNSLESQFILSIFTIPLILYNSNEVSLLVIIFSLIFNMIFSEIFIPLSYLTIIFYPIGFIYEYIASLLNGIIKMLSNFSFTFSYSICSIYSLIFIYFYLFYIFRYKNEFKKMIKGIMIVLFSLSIDFLISRISFIPKLIMLDVNQGDSLLIRTIDQNILIDTGEYDKYDTIISYLKNKNINKIDTIFISHTDSDHYSNLENIISKIKTDQVVMPNDKNYYQFKNVSMYSIRYIKDSTNNSSMILYTIINNRKILLTGDIEKETEEELLKEYNIKADILKVAHHGSSSSSTESFINKVNPNISLISVGLNNKYNHPSDEVIERLNNIDTKIFRTDTNGTVTIYLFRNFYLVKTYKKSNVLLFQNLQNLRLII